MCKWYTQCPDSHVKGNGFQEDCFHGEVCDVREVKGGDRSRREVTHTLPTPALQSGAPLSIIHIVKE